MQRRNLDLWPDHILGLIKTMAADGKTAVEIAARLNTLNTGEYYTTSMCSRAAANWGIKLPKQDGPFSGPVKDALLALHARGVMPTEIQRTLNSQFGGNLSLAQIRRAIVRHIPRDPRPTPYPPEVLAMVRELYAAGNLTIRRIADHLTSQFGKRYSQSSVADCIERHGMERGQEYQDRMAGMAALKRDVIERVNLRRLGGAVRPPDNPRRYVPPGTFKAPQGGFSMLRGI